MKHLNIALIGVLAAGMSLACHSGNVARKGNVELHMGRAKNATVARQIADPTAAERNTEAVEGLDGPTASGVIETYHHNEKVVNQERRLRDRSLRRVR